MQKATNGKGRAQLLSQLKQIFNRVPELALKHDVKRSSGPDCGFSPGLFPKNVHVFGGIPKCVKIY